MHGFAATSIEQVAATSEAVATRSTGAMLPKAELLQSAFMAARHRILAQLDMEASPEASALERLRSYARQLLAISVAPDLVALKRISLHEMMTTGKQPGENELSDPLRTRLVQLVVQAQEAGTCARTTRISSRPSSFMRSRPGHPSRP